MNVIRFLIMCVLLTGSPTSAEVQPALVGQVVDEGDKPVAGADVYFNRLDERSYTHLGQTDKDGKFRYDVEQPVDSLAQLVVRTDQKLGWDRASNFYLKDFFDGPEEKTIQLRSLVPVSGTIKDQTGVPESGLKVRMIRAWQLRKDLDEVIALDRDFGDTILIAGDGSFLAAVDASDVLPRATTDNAGKATVKLPVDCIVQLLVWGQAIGPEEVWIRTDQGERVEIAYAPSNPNTDKAVLHSQQFELTTSPAVPLIGKVVHQDTGVPIANATVEYFRPHRAGIVVDVESFLFPMTDEQGTFQLPGLEIGRHRVYVKPPPGSALVPIEQYIKIDKGSLLKPVEFHVPQGVIITGKVLDQETEQPIEGSVHYFALFNNEAAAKMGRTEISGDANHAIIDESGAFRIVGLPGPGLLTVRARSGNYLRNPSLDQLDTAIKEIAGSEMILATPHYVNPRNCHLIEQIDPQGEELYVDLKLQGPSKKVRIQFVNKSDLDFSQVYFSGENPEIGVFNVVYKTNPAYINFFEANEKQRRLVQLRTRNYKLAGWDMVWDYQEVATIELHPAATLTGRVIDAAGKPVVGARLKNDYFTDASARMARVPSQPDSGYTTFTDNEGRFKLVGLPGDLPLSMRISTDDEKGRSILRGYVFKDLTVKYGEAKDLGDIHMDRLIPLERD